MMTNMLTIYNENDNRNGEGILCGAYLMYEIYTHTHTYTRIRSDLILTFVCMYKLKFACLLYDKIIRFSFVLPF